MEKLKQLINRFLFLIDSGLENITYTELKELHSKCDDLINNVINISELSEEEFEEYWNYYLTFLVLEKLYTISMAQRMIASIKIFSDNFIKNKIKQN